MRFYCTSAGPIGGLNSEVLLEIHTYINWSQMNVGGLNCDVLLYLHNSKYHTEQSIPFPGTAIVEQGFETPKLETKEERARSIINTSLTFTSSGFLIKGRSAYE